MRELLRRAWYFLRHRRLDDELAEEIECHRAMAQEAFESSGIAHDEATLAARRALGNDRSARERARDVWIWPWFQDIAQDIRYAVRLLAKDRWLATTAILALAVGAGVNGTMFAIFNAYCIAGVPIERAARVVFLSTRDTRAQARGLSYSDVEEMRRAAPAALASLGAFSVGSVSLGDEGRSPDRYVRAYMSASGFALMRQQPMLGRDFRDDDDRVGAAPTVILSSRVWKARYGGDPTILGRAVLLNRGPTVVIGVMPDGFHFPNRADLWQPLRLMTSITTELSDQRTLAGFGRLVDGVSIPQAQAELSTLGSRLAEEFPADNAGIEFVAEPINRRYNADITHPAWAAFVAVGVLVLLVACANVANLLLTRAVSRSREIAIRASLGATRRRVIRQLLVESALLAALGSALGLALARVGLALWTRAIPAIGIPYAGFVLDGFVLAIFAAASCLTVFVFGLAPALTLAKTDVNRTLKDGGRGLSGPSSRRWTAVFLSAELGVMILLLLRLVSGVRDAEEWQKLDERIDAAPLLTAWLALPVERYSSVEARRAFHERLAARLSGSGEVSAYTVASVLPLAGARSQQFEMEGRPLVDDRVAPIARTVTVGARYFETLGLPLLRGRELAPGDGRDDTEGIIVNQRFADLHLPDEEAVGQRMRIRRDGAAPFSPWMRIVGIAPNIRQTDRPEINPIAYLPFEGAAPATVAVILRSATGPETVVARLRQEVGAIDDDLPIYRAMPMEAAIAEASYPSRIGGQMLGVIAAIVAVLAMLGLYAVTTHSVNQRAAEIGVRMALGARPGQVRSLVLRRVARQTGAGLVVGLIGSVAWNRFVFSGSWTQSGVDLGTLGMVLPFVAGVVLVASIVPVWRATRVDPVSALRSE